MLDWWLGLVVHSRLKFEPGVYIRATFWEVFLWSSPITWLTVLLFLSLAQNSSLRRGLYAFVFLGGWTAKLYLINMGTVFLPFPEFCKNTWLGTSHSNSMHNRRKSFQGLCSAHWRSFLSRLTSCLWVHMLREAQHLIVYRSSVSLRSCLPDWICLDRICNSRKEKASGSITSWFWPPKCTISSWNPDASMEAVVLK